MPILQPQDIVHNLTTKGRFWIVFTGDSITSCEWVHPNWREIVEYVLKQECQKGKDWKTPSWGIRCFNFAYDGATTADIRAKLPDVLHIQADLTIAMIGANDSILSISVDEHIENIRHIKDTVERSGSLFVYSTDNCPWDETAAQQYAPYVDVAEDINFLDDQHINLFELSQSFPHERIYTFASEEILEAGIKKGDLDFWHPNQLGNAYIARVILDNVFSITFDPEKYIKTTLAGEKYPLY